MYHVIFMEINLRNKKQFTIQQFENIRIHQFSIKKINASSRKKSVTNYGIAWMELNLTNLITMVSSQKSDLPILMQISVCSLSVPWWYAFLKTKSHLTMILMMKPNVFYKVSNFRKKIFLQFGRQLNFLRWKKLLKMWPTMYRTNLPWVALIALNKW